MPERLEPGNVSDWCSFGYQHLQRYRFALDRLEGDRVLDLACGVGYGSYILAQSRGRSVTGIDLSPAAIEYGRTHYQHTGLRLITGNALTWENDGPQFDTIVSFETIEHLPEPAAFIARIARLIKPGGVLFVSAPNTLQHKLAPVPIENEYHVSEPDYSMLRSWIEPHFVIESEWEQSPILSPGVQTIPSLQRDLDTLSRRWWLRAANRIEGAVRRICGAAGKVRPASDPLAMTASTDIFPLLPERRVACAVFLFVCRAPLD